MKIDSYKPGSAVTNQAGWEALEKQAQLAKSQVQPGTFQKEAFKNGPGHNIFPDKGMYGGSTQTPQTTANLKAADEFVEAANKKTLANSSRGRALIAKISGTMRKFKFGKALKKLLRKIPFLARFIGVPVAVIGYIADSSTAHAATIPYWVNRFHGLRNKFKTSSDPLEQLECLRKMCAITYKHHQPVQRSFDASILAARLVYQEEPGKRQQLVASMTQIFAGYRQSAGEVGYILQDLCTAANSLMRAVQTAYGHQPQYVSRLKNYRNYFQHFENASKGYVKVSAQLVPSPVNVSAELATPVSGLSF